MLTAIDIRQWESYSNTRSEMWIDIIEREIGFCNLVSKKSSIKWQLIIEMLERHILTPDMRKQINSFPCPDNLDILNQQLLLVYHRYKNN
jgi:hypothetical protein